MRGKLALFIAAFALGATAAAAGPSGYHFVRAVPLAGDGFWDYLGFDLANRHLFITHGTHVMVLDADTQAVVGDIPNTPRAHGVAVADDLNRGFVSDGGDNTVTAFDLKSLKVLGRYATGTGPDSITYDPVSHRVFTFNGGSNDATALDSARGVVAGTIPLAGKPETGVADDQGRIFANIESTSEIVEIDARTLKITARWPLKPCDGPSGLAIDREHGVLFAGCENEMAIVSTKDDSVLASLPIGKGVDADRFDPGPGYAFASTGSGAMTIIHEDGSTKFSLVENVTTQPGARTMEIDPKTHTVYLVTADRVAVQPAADNPYPQPAIVPGSFRLLVYAPGK